MVTKVGNAFTRMDRNLTKFFHPGAYNTTSTNVIKRAIQKPGAALNNGTYKVSNAIGKKLVANIDKGGILSKSPFMTKLANGLKNMGTKTANKMPGLGTVFALGTAAVSIFKAGKMAFQGKFKAAGHELLKGAGSTVGVMAGWALMMTGVGFLPGLALAIGSGMACDWAGKKVADTVFPSVAEEIKAKEEAMKQQQAAVQQEKVAVQQELANQGITYSHLGGTDQQFDAYIQSLYESAGVTV